MEDDKLNGRQGGGDSGGGAYPNPHTGKEGGGKDGFLGSGGQTEKPITARDGWATRRPATIPTRRRKTKPCHSGEGRNP